ILGYTSCAVLLARYLQAHGLKPYRPHALITSAEVLTEPDRALLEGTFGCPVFNRYGSREVSVIATECAPPRRLHVMAEGLGGAGERPPAGGSPAPSAWGPCSPTRGRWSAPASATSASGGGAPAPAAAACPACAASPAGSASSWSGPTAGWCRACGCCTR